jgi:hypothetical protein
MTRNIGRVAAASVALVLVVAVSAASANELRVAGGRLWKMVFRPLRFVSAGITAVSCELTLEGSLHSGTLTKVQGALRGHITRASIGGCSAGSATVLRETLPWHVVYLGFQGRLPEISGVELLDIGASYQIRDAIFGSICLLRTTEAEPTGAIAQLGAMEAGGSIPVESVNADETKLIRCGSLNGNIEGTATIAEVSSGARLSVRLI